MHLHGDILVHCGTTKQTVKVVNFDACIRPVELIGYHSSDRKTNFNLIILTHISTNSESLVTIGLVHSDLFGAICQFLPSFWPSCLKNFTTYSRILRDCKTKVHQIFSLASRTLRGTT